MRRRVGSPFAGASTRILWLVAALRCLGAFHAEAAKTRLTADTLSTIMRTSLRNEFPGGDKRDARGRADHATLSDATSHEWSRLRLGSSMSRVVKGTSVGDDAATWIVCLKHHAGGDTVLQAVGPIAYTS